MRKDFCEEPPVPNVAQRRRIARQVGTASKATSFAMEPSGASAPRCRRAACARLISISGATHRSGRAPAGECLRDLSQLRRQRFACRRDGVPSNGARWHNPRDGVHLGRGRQLLPSTPLGRKARGSRPDRSHDDGLGWSVVSEQFLDSLKRSPPPRQRMRQLFDVAVGTRRAVDLNIVARAGVTGHRSPRSVAVA